MKSIAELKQEIADLSEQLEIAETDGQRRSLQFQIEEAELEISDFGNTKSDFDVAGLSESDPYFNDEDEDEDEENHYKGFHAPDMMGDFDEENQGW